jgi:hypothetical protein
MNSFPKYNSQRRTGDKGVTLIKSIVENEFDWIFRPTHLEDDFGLDGYFDIIGIDNSVTGKYLGVQIKTGKSYFTSKTSIGWKYVGENKHLNYFLNSNFPILIILVDIELRKAFWVEFDINKTDKNTNGWSIIVPKVNNLDTKSKSAIQNLTGDIIDYMSQIEYQWEINEQIKDSSLVLLNVSRDEIEGQDISGFTELLSRLLINDDMIKKAKGKLSFMIDGYNHDEREIYEIPEVREWTKKVIPAFKYWGYFLNMDEYLRNKAGLRMLHFCFVDIKVVSTDNILKRKFVEADKHQSIEFLNQLFEWLNEFTDKYNISLEVNKEQSFLIGNTLFGLDKDE